MNISSHRSEARRLSPMLWAACLVVSLAALMHGGSAAAASEDRSPVALVMQVSGATTPPLVRYREVAAGNRITLSPRSKVALLHYASCSIVTLSGGTATVTAEGIEAAAVNVESTRPGPCPRVHQIAFEGGASSGGVSVARLAGITANPASVTTLAADGVIQLSGAVALSAQYYELRDGFGRTLATRVPIRDGGIALDGRQSAYGPYTFSIHVAGTAQPVDVQMFLSRSASASMLIVRQVDDHAL